jgi:putative endonuclease
MGRKFYTYVLLSENDKGLYIGHTNNIDERLKLHNNGKVILTRNRNPFILVKLEEYETRSEAFRREQYLKSGQGREWLHDQLKDLPAYP